MTAEPSTAAHLHALTERQATFKHLSNGKKRRTDASNSSSQWPLPANHSVTPAALATAGFYYAPLPDAQDNATCFLCGKGLGGWEDGDQALQEHVSHSIKSSVKKGCPFALLTSGAERLRELGLEEGKDLVKMRKETFGKKSKFWVHAGQRGWPTPDKMANAGFFLRATDARSDAGQCCWCGLTLDGWEKGDEPLHEHYKRRPTCHLFEAYPALLLQAQAAIGSSAEAAPVDTTAIDDGWEQIDADTTNTNATSSKSRSKTSSRSKAKEQQPDESNASVTGVIASSSVAHGPLTRSTRSGMIASLASTSQPAQSQSTSSSKSSRSKSRSTTRGAKAADTSQVQLAEASIAEQPEPDDSVELVQQPKKSSKNSRKEESETAPRSGKSSSSSSSSTGTKSRAAAKQKKAATPEKDVAEEEVEGNHSDAPAPEADEELPEPAPAPVPTPTEAPAPEDEEPAPIPNGNVEPQPERASDPESPPQQHRNDATQLSVVQEGDEDEDGDGEEEQQPAPSSSAAGHKSSIPLLSQLQSRQLRSPPPQASSSQDKASSKGKANATTTKTKDEDSLTSGLDDAQLNMSVQEWFRHLTEVEIARAEQEMQAKLDEYDQSVEKGWERLRGMGIAQ